MVLLFSCRIAAIKASAFTGTPSSVNVSITLSLDVTSRTALRSTNAACSGLRGMVSAFLTLTLRILYSVSVERSVQGPSFSTGVACAFF